MADDIEQELSQLADLAYIQIGRREKRPLCNKCSRPVGVCWCSSLGGKRVNTSCRVIILQHPHEEKRCLRTSPILQAALPPHAYIEIKAKRFPLSRFPQLEEIFTSNKSVLMYPGDKATSIDNIPTINNHHQHQQPISSIQQTSSSSSYNIIIIDGTWQQAKSMYHNCKHLHHLPQVRLSGEYVSKYVIRTQPTEDALSTVETAAIALATLEQDWSIYTTLVHPLQLLCQYQIKHGAVPHQSREHMIASGRFRKPMGKRTFKKLRKCGAKHSEGETLNSFITQIQNRNNEENVEENERVERENEEERGENEEGERGENERVGRDEEEEEEEGRENEEGERGENEEEKREENERVEKDNEGRRENEEGRDEDGESKNTNDLR